MNHDPLRIVSVEKTKPHPKHGSDPKTTRTQAAKDYYERRWQQEPQQFNPNRNAIERVRIQRTWALLQPLAKPGIQAIDLGCGWGLLAEKMAEQGVSVDALDIAPSALERLKSHPKQTIRLLCDAAPSTSLQDDAYDVVLCTDLVAELYPQEHRLLISELYRIAKPDGRVICSTPLDIRSDGALERFASLIETELEPENWVLSHHAYYLKLRHLLHTPARYARAMTDEEFYQKKRSKKGALGRVWFKLNSSPPLGYFWKAIAAMLRPLARRYDQSQSLLLKLESLCRFLSPDDGVSHVLILAKLKSLSSTRDVDVQAMSRPVQRLRQRVWE